MDILKKTSYEFQSLSEGTSGGFPHHAGIPIRAYHRRPGVRRLEEMIYYDEGI
jgi:hypothetical protein